MNSMARLVEDKMAILNNLEEVHREEIDKIRVALSMKICELIVLRHQDRSTIPERIMGVDGLSPLVEDFDMATGVRSMTTEVKEGRHCVFIPDRYTRLRYAFLPKTDHNMRVLATHLAEQRWEILDEDILERVKEMKKDMPETRDVSLMKRRMNEQSFQRPAGQYEALTNQEIESEVEKRKRELAELEASIARRKKEVDDESPTPEDPTPVSTPEAPAMSVAQAKKIVHKKFERELAEIKATKKNYWLTPFYRKNIKPQIDVLVNPMLSQAVEPEKVEEPAKAG